jgi:hypothetical protein
MDLAGLDGQGSFYDALAGPLFKGFLTFRQPWWQDSDLDGCCFVTGNELQKLYFDTGRRTIYFYCDSSNSNYWATLRSSGDSVFRDTLEAKVEQAVGRELPDLKRAEEFVSRHWPIGITYLEHGTAFDSTGCLRIADRIHFSTGAFTGNPGWIEGVLANASQLASGLNATAKGRAGRRHAMAGHARTTGASCRYPSQPTRIRRHNPSIVGARTR